MNRERYMINRTFNGRWLSHKTFDQIRYGKELESKTHNIRVIRVKNTNKQYYALRQAVEFDIREAIHYLQNRPEHPTRKSHSDFSESIRELQELKLILDKKTYMEDTSDEYKNLYVVPKCMVLHKGYHTAKEKRLDRVKVKRDKFISKWDKGLQWN